MPQGLSRPEARRAAIGWQSSQGSTHMTAIRTALNLRKHETRRLINDGYEIMHIETHHRESGDESWIVWTQPVRPDDIPESELPY